MASEILGRDFAVAMHQHDQRPLGFIFHHQGLDDGMFIHAEFTGADGGATFFFVLVEVIGEYRFVLAQHADRSRHRGFVMTHCKALVPA